MITITPEAERAYRTDEGVRYKKILTDDEVVRRIIEVKDREEWAKSFDYDRPLKKIVLPRQRISVGSFIKMLLP